MVYPTYKCHNKERLIPLRARDQKNFTKKIQAKNVPSSYKYRLTKMIFREFKISFVAAFFFTGIKIISKTINMMHCCLNEPARFLNVPVCNLSPTSICTN